MAAYGIAITKYRLYDIDVVISRTFVYGSLAVFIGVVYVAVVVGVGALVGSPGEPNTALAIAATALVAVAFQPLRRRLERVANRLVFGRKATPYEVLSDFSRRMAATSDTLLDDAARSLARGHPRRAGCDFDRRGGRHRRGGRVARGVRRIVDRHRRFPIEDAGVILGSLGSSTCGTPGPRERRPPAGDGACLRHGARPAQPVAHGGPRSPSGGVA